MGVPRPKRFLFLVLGLYFPTFKKRFFSNVKIANIPKNFFFPLSERKALNVIKFFGGPKKKGPQSALKN